MELSIITKSRLQSFGLCQRLHHLQYDLGYRPIQQGAKAAFGSFVHAGLDAWWMAHARGEGLLALSEATVAMAKYRMDHQSEIDDFDDVRGLILMTAYDARWAQTMGDWEVLGSEVEFVATIPGRKRLRVAGKLDKLLRRRATGRIWFAEHKCVAGDSQVFNHETGTFEAIEDLHRDGRSFVVSAMDEATGMIVHARAKTPAKAQVCPIVSITTRGGRCLRVSEKHPIWTQHGWLEAKDVVDGDWVGVPRATPSWREDAAMSDESIRLIGYMIGDGSLGGGGLVFTKNDQVVLDDVIRCASAIGEERKISSPPTRAKYIGFRSVGPVADLMKRADLLGRLAADKRIPWNMALSDRQLGQLLGALWSTDGCIDANGSKIRIIYGSMSWNLCCDIQYALQRLGIVSNVRATSVRYEGTRRPFFQVHVISRAAIKRFLSMAIDGAIPILRSALAPQVAIGMISTSRQGDDSTKQPTLDPNIWWDKVFSIVVEPAEQTYDVEVPGVHTFVVDGVVTHNTSGSDLSAGSVYWQRLRMDPQVSIYFDGSRALGHEDVEGCLYDVIERPDQRPLQATPMEKRKYTKATAKEPSRLYSNQRDSDESVAEFRERLGAIVTVAPESYFGRAEVVRLEAEMEASRADVEELAIQIRSGSNTGVAPRNPGACFQYGRACDFFDVCCGIADLADVTRFRKVENVHEELSLGKAKE